MPGMRNSKDPDGSLEAFRTYLKQNGIKLTNARRAILEVTLEINKHFEAEEVLYALKERGLNVGKATVYRTLPLLVDCGILKQVRFDVKQAHYERIFGEEPHDHFVCLRCRRIIEFSSDELISAGEKIGRKRGFIVTGHRIQLTGICANCAEQHRASL
ncbi:MAG: Fur family transcriptional regulator [Phycisphaerae bacterium]